MGSEEKEATSRPLRVNAKSALSAEMREAASSYLDINSCVY